MLGLAARSTTLSRRSFFPARTFFRIARLRAQARKVAQLRQPPDAQAAVTILAEGLGQTVGKALGASAFAVSVLAEGLGSAPSANLTDVEVRLPVWENYLSQAELASMPAELNLSEEYLVGAMGEIYSLELGEPNFATAKSNVHLGADVAGE